MARQSGELAPEAIAAIEAQLAAGEAVLLTIAGADGTGFSATADRGFLAKGGRLRVFLLRDVRSVRWGTGFRKWLLFEGAPFDPTPPGLTTLNDHPHALRVDAIDEAARRQLDGLIGAARGREPGAGPVPARLTSDGLALVAAPATETEVGSDAEALLIMPDGSLAFPPDDDDDEEEEEEEEDDWVPAPGVPLADYKVIYLGGLPRRRESSIWGIRLVVWRDGFELIPGQDAAAWFGGLGIPFTSVTGIEIVNRTVRTLEYLIGSKDNVHLVQPNNIEIAFGRGQRQLVLRLEMISGITVMGQAGRCRELLDVLRANGILRTFAANARAAEAPAEAPADDIPSRIRALAALRDEGLLTPAEFEAKKADLLSRM